MIEGEELRAPDHALDPWGGALRGGTAARRGSRAFGTLPESIGGFTVFLANSPDGSADTAPTGDLRSSSMADKPQIFVAYPYSISKADYRGAFKKVASQYGVRFLYADERITNKQILNKIIGMIEESDFAIFDVTTWNANVALELGVAIGSQQDYYILFNPTTGQEHPPSDLGGIDRLEYRDFAELADEVGRLMRQQFGAPKKERKEADVDRLAQFVVQLEEIKSQIPAIVASDPGMPIGSIASAIGLPVEYTQTLVRPLVGVELRTEGVKRGTRYFPIERLD